MASVKTALLVTTLCSALLAAFPVGAADSALASAAQAGAAAQPARQLAELAERYYDAQVRFDPVNATFAGDNRHDDELTMTIRPQVRARLYGMLHGVHGELMAIDRSKLSSDDLITFDSLNAELNAALALEAFPDHLLPLNQMESMPVLLANLAGGQSAQSIGTVAQYQAFLKRIGQLPEWIEVAIANMRQGMREGVVQPTALMQATLPQIKALCAATPEASEFYAPIKHLPAGFSSADKARLSAAYRTLIGSAVLPSLRKLAAFIDKEYLPATRASAGWGSLPNGAAWYRAWVAYQTSSTLTPEQIHAIGLREMARNDAELNKLAPRLGYSGAPAGMGNFLAAQPKYRPFKTDAQVLDAYASLNRKIMQRLPELFATMPKAALEIRAEPALTRDAASDHYNAAAADGSRPGIFWAVIPDPGAYASTRMTSLFLHEGQPGHHFQLSKQQELAIPLFRKFGANNAYVEGWALYAETLGRELGLYDDPNAYAGFLMLDQRRAARLVVDTGLHALGWTREQTIAFLVEKVGDTEASARNATERYMAWPGQALGYKIGALKILELRQRAQAALGPKFKLAQFHDTILKNGSVPLTLLEANVERWIAEQAR